MIIISTPTPVKLAGKIYRAQPQVIASGLSVVVATNGTSYQFGLGGMEDNENNRLNILKSGIYMIECFGRFYTGVLPGKEYQISIENSAGQLGRDRICTAGEAIEAFCNFKMGYYLSAGDWLQYEAYHNTGADVELEDGEDSNFLSAYLYA